MSGPNIKRYLGWSPESEKLLENVGKKMLKKSAGRLLRERILGPETEAEKAYLKDLKSIPYMIGVRKKDPPPAAAMCPFLGFDWIPNENREKQQRELQNKWYWLDICYQEKIDYISSVGWGMVILLSLFNMSIWGYVFLDLIFWNLSLIWSFIGEYWQWMFSFSLGLVSFAFANFIKSRKT